MIPITQRNNGGTGNEPKNLFPSAILCLLICTASRPPPASRQAANDGNRKSKPSRRRIGSPTTPGCNPVRRFLDYPVVEDACPGFPGTQSHQPGLRRLPDRRLHLLCHRIVIPYKPRLIVLRAGVNDIDASKTPEQVRDDFQAFVEKVRAKLPRVRIAYLTINATPARWANVEREKKANQLIKDYIGKGENLDYIDTFDATMGADGKPREELFIKDRLHFNAEGYKILDNCGPIPSEVT